MTENADRHPTPWRAIAGGVRDARDRTIFTIHADNYYPRTQAEAEALAVYVVDAVNMRAAEAEAATT